MRSGSAAGALLKPFGSQFAFLESTLIRTAKSPNRVLKGKCPAACVAPPLLQQGQLGTKEEFVSRAATPPSMQPSRSTVA